MKSSPLSFPGAQAWLQYQPLGVVGVVSPWNFPLILAFGPLAGVLLAGNRALLKPSEATPRKLGSRSGSQALANHLRRLPGQTNALVLAEMTKNHISGSESAAVIDDRLDRITDQIAKSIGARPKHRLSISGRVRRICKSRSVSVEKRRKQSARRTVPAA